MPQYLVAIQDPNNYDPSLEGEAMIRDISAQTDETFISTIMKRVRTIK